MRHLGSTIARWWGGSLVGRLCADRAGNVLILAAAMLIPLLALIGSGVDIGRVYVARSRMQQACDAASLAGRWAVAAGKDTGVVQQEALKYFKFNFDYTTSTLSTKPFTPAVAVSNSGSRAVTITAATTIPMSLMGMFDMKDMAVTATCSAQQDFVNIDIVMVLDVTGSMGSKASSGDTQTKIQGLRAAVLALYDQLAQIEPKLKAAGMRLRYSIVPYSSSVNLKDALYTGVGPSTMQTDSQYQHCPDYMAVQRYQYASCTLGPKKNHPADWFAGTWNGCIEERATVNSIGTSTGTIPDTAYDLQIDREPDSQDTRWIPEDKDEEQAVQPYNPSAKGIVPAPADCPAGAVRLKSWVRGDLSTYVNNLAAVGTTFHDIGLVWGARMISANGVFKDSPTSYNGMPVTKYMIFMTDGDLNADEHVYAAWGVEGADKRTTPDGTYAEAQNTHTQRTTLLCNAIKNAGTSIWVIGFGQKLQPYMQKCATNAGQYSVAADSSSLVNQFKAIGQSIGALRLSQ